MSLVERRIVDGRLYEVRRVRGALTLYTDGVLHTHFDAKRPISGRVWDLLALPGIVTRAQTALVLGVAGGAAIRQLLVYGAITHIDGVDLDEEKLGLGRAHFGLDDPRVHLHHADARDFVAKGPKRYDVIVDDVFLEVDGEPRRAIRYDAAWGRAVMRRLSPRGVLVVNSAGRHETRQSVLVDPRFTSRFANVLELRTETAGNIVHVCTRRPLDAVTFRRAARAALGADASRLRLTARTLATRAR
jgi:spermidine synthase